MSKQTNFPFKMSLKKQIGSVEFFLGKGWDLSHGKGYFCHAYHDDFRIGFGFHKTNKFIAVRIALRDLKQYRGEKYV